MEAPKYKIAVIIVNYNVAHYLEQCLYSVRRAMSHCCCQVFVVDNNSVDGSCSMIEELFPEVTLLRNTQNVGFSKANNQAIRQSEAEYILLLNPDTVLEKKTLLLLSEYMDNHQNVGGMGVKMIDGNGLFLPESKRGFPSPSVAFYKFSGLSRLFPMSKRFNAYHLGYLDKDEIQKVDVLSGACMFLRFSVLEKIGLLDEDYFMYGEDIDLSYRIINAGFENVYFPRTTIIHYKGQSTQKASFNYVVLFYTAMKIFAQKYFSKTHAQTFMFMINIAIWARATLSLMKRLFVKLLYPLADWIIMFFGLAVFSPLWGQYKYGIEGYDFPQLYYQINVPLYASIVVVIMFLMGTYLRPVSMKKVFWSLFYSSIFTILIYALLPEIYRYSRASFLFCILWQFVSIPCIRLMFSVLWRKEFALRHQMVQKTVIVGTFDECVRVNDLIKNLQNQTVVAGYVNCLNDNENHQFLGQLQQLSDIVSVHKINCVIFCEKDVPEKTIIASMITLSSRQVQCKIVPRHSLFIVGNNNVDTLSSFYTVNINAIISFRNTWIKRCFDLIMIFVIMLLSPLLMYFNNKRISVCRSLMQVLVNKRTWVGFNRNYNSKQLKNYKKGIIEIASLKESENVEKINVMYAQDYSVSKDLKRIWDFFIKNET